MGMGLISLFNQCFPDHIDNRINFLQHLIVPKPENSKTSRLQALIANTILLTILMLTAIHLHNQLLLQAGEIQHKIQKRMLTAELETRELPTTQTAPQAMFGVRHTPTQRTLKRIVDDGSIGLAFHRFIVFADGLG